MSEIFKNIFLSLANHNQVVSIKHKIAITDEYGNRFWHTQILADRNISDAADWVGLEPTTSCVPCDIYWAMDHAYTSSRGYQSIVFEILAQLIFVRIKDNSHDKMKNVAFIDKHYFVLYSII